jgi:L-fucose isomerase and related proteins
MLNKEEIFIGYCTAGDTIGLPKDFIYTINREGSNALKDLGYNIIEFPNILNDYKTAYEFIDFFAKNKAKIIIINVAAWYEAGITLKIVRNLSNVTFIFWAFGNYNQTLTLTGLLENTSTMIKTNYKNFYTIIGPPEKTEVKNELSSTLKAISLYKSLELINIGMIGSTCPGMVDSTFDEISLRKIIGCNLKHLDLTELIEIYNNILDSDLSEEIKLIESTIKRILVSKNDLLSNIKLYKALKKLIEEYKLDAFTIRCWPELKSNTLGYNITPCFALSKLSDEGIIGACESDVSAAITMLILRCFTGTPPVGLEYNTLDTRMNSITLWHCGANAMSLADSNSKIMIGKPSNGGLMELNHGMSVEFTLKEGIVTLAKLTREFNKMVISTGKIIKPSQIYRGGICEVVLDINVLEYFSNIIKEGIEHHVCLVYGDIKKELIQLAKLMMIDYIVL